MRVIVAGGGIGGLATALALARRGARVCVVERARAFSEVGAGLQLAPNATRLLYSWGLQAALARIAFAPRAADIRDRGDGALLLTTPLGPQALTRWGAPYLQVHRADLHAILLAEVEAAGVELRTDSPVDGFDSGAAGVTLQIAGERMTGEVLIGADGVHSRVRSAVMGETPARFTGQVAWRGLVPAERLPAGLIAPTATVWTGPGAHFVHYFVRGGALVNFAGFTAERRWREESWTQPTAPSEIARAFAGWPEPVTALVAALLKGGGAGWRSAVHDRPPRRGWARGPVALMGDAAHPMPPYLAQGAGMAIEDAEAIARHLAGHLAPTAALKAYAGERFDRVRRVQAWARRNAVLFHLPTALRRAAFAAGRLGDGSARLDWLYGYAPPDGDLGTPIESPIPAP